MKFPELNKSQLILACSGTVIVVAIIIVIAVYWNKIKARIADRRLERSFDEQITASEVTITEQQAKALADKLYSAMDGGGTNEQKIYDVFEQINSYSDLMMVMKAFGTRKGWWNWWGSESGLAEWLNDDCSADEIAKINAILASKNINFSF